MKSIFRETEEGGLLYPAARYIQKQAYKIVAQDEDGRSFAKKFPRSPQHHRVSDDIAGRQIAYTECKYGGPHCSPQRLFHFTLNAEGMKIFFCSGKFSYSEQK